MSEGHEDLLKRILWYAERKAVNYEGTSVTLDKTNNSRENDMRVGTVARARGLRNKI